MTKKCLVISGVNLVEAGPLSVYKDCLNSLLKWNVANFKIIALVNSIQLFEEFEKRNITFIEYPEIKKSWISRLIFEYYTCKSISKTYNCDVWLAMHDITPNVTAATRIVYCHNPAPFYKITFKEAWIEKSFFAFNLLYKFLYGINIKKNNYVIVQQEWIRNYFVHRYNIKNVIVAYPNVDTQLKKISTAQDKKNVFRFVYPAFPRVFKNFEVLLKAAEELKNITEHFEVIVTITGDENRYAKYIFTKFKHVKQIKFIGRQPREAVYQLYEKCDCLIFPSKLETWGLPITEMKMHNKPILVADCKYAHETVGKYDKVCFFNPVNSSQLKSLMESAITNTLSYDPATLKLPSQPFTQSWQQLFDVILN